MQSLPPLQDSLKGIWICHNCDAHCPAKNKRCGSCKKWRSGKRDTVGHSKKATTKKVTSPSVAGHKRKEGPPATIAIASKNVTTSPLPGLNSLADDQTTEGDSLQTSITGAQRHEENDEVIKNSRPGR